MQALKKAAAYVLLMLAVISIVGLPFAFLALKEVTEQRCEEKALAHHNKTDAAAQDAVKSAHAEGRNDVSSLVSNVFLSDDSAVEVLHKLGKTEEQIDEMDEDVILKDAEAAVKGDLTLLKGTEGKYILVDSGFAEEKAEAQKAVVEAKTLLEKAKTDLKTKEEALKATTAKTDAAKTNSWLGYLTGGRMVWGSQI